MITRYVVTIDVEARNEAESWRLFNERLTNGEGKLEHTVLQSDPVATVVPRQSCILPTDTIPACRNGDTLPCSGVKVRSNIHQQKG
jgi:hypothetical protein